MMDFCEQMLRAVVFTVLGHTHVQFGDHELDFGNMFRRVGMEESLSGLVEPDQITNDKVVELFEAARRTRIWSNRLSSPTFRNRSRRYRRLRRQIRRWRSVLSCTSRDGDREWVF